MLHYILEGLAVAGVDDLWSSPDTRPRRPEYSPSDRVSLGELRPYARYASWGTSTRSRRDRPVPRHGGLVVKTRTSWCPGGLQTDRRRAR